MKRKNVLKAGILLATLLFVLSASIASATLTITPVSGFGIGERALIKNTGTTTENNIQWNINFTVFSGSLFIPPAPKYEKTGTITTLTPGGVVTVRADVFGFAKVKATIFASDSAGSYSVVTPLHHVFIIFTY